MCFKILYSLYLRPFIGLRLHKRDLKKQYEHELKKPQKYDFSSMIVYQIPYLADNYAYILQDEHSGKFCIIDGADSQAVQNAIDVFDLD
jgi:hypothetical protein